MVNMNPINIYRYRNCLLSYRTFSTYLFNKLGSLTLRLGHTWEVSAWEIAHLRSCLLVNYLWEVAALEKAFGKVPHIFGKVPNIFGKVPNIFETTLL